MLSSFLWDWPQPYVVYQAQQELYTNYSLLVDEFQDLALVFLVSKYITVNSYAVCIIK